VQPAAIDYRAAGPEIAWVGDESGVANVRRVLSRRGTVPVTIRFLDPVDPVEAGERKALAVLCRTSIIDALGRPSAPSGGSADRI
jgi:1-acyl-sn-glycerol-3-phosphate acyltransferase